MIEDAIHFVEHARALERPPHGGCELVNCTPWAYRDCYSYMMQTWPTEYRVYKRHLLENPLTGEPDVVNGESIFPESISTEKAKDMHARNSYVFISQFQCLPRAGKETSFQSDWVRPCLVERNATGEPCFRIPEEHYDPTRVHSHVSHEEAPNVVPLSWCDRTLLIDPAPSKKAERTQEPRARNGLVVVFVDPWGRHFTPQAVGLREDPVTVMEAAVLLCVRWKVHKVGIESVNFSSVYGPLWTAILRHRHPKLDLSFIPLLPEGEDKDTRIRRLMAPLKEGLWYFGPESSYVTQELLEYPHGETRDLIDGMAYWHKCLSRPETPDERELYHYQQAGWVADRSVTGY